MFSYKNYTFKHYWREYVLLALLLANVLVWLSLHGAKTNLLNVYFFDVGQGDAIFIETPSRRQVLIDGGKNRRVVSELGRVMRFGDKDIDIIIATHPDADHIGGLPEVIRRYDVELFVEPGVADDSDLNAELHTRIGQESAQTLLARRGQVINFGDGVLLHILFPHTDVSEWESNDASIVAKLSYGEIDFLLPGDASIQTENVLTSQSGDTLDVEVLKAGHHGSRTSTSLTFAEATSPEYTIISAGKDNTYGHPHREVLNILNKVGSKILNTADHGTIKFETDGNTLNIK